MRIALIPPIPELGVNESTGMHLLLSHLMKDDRYVAHYVQQREEGDYLILDNSAHEHGTGNTIDKLLRQVKALGAQEVVLPDVLFDAHATINKTGVALDWLKQDKGMRAYVAAGEPRLMIVPQGNDKSAEWGYCLRKLLSEFDKVSIVSKPPVVGVSKDYDFFRGGLVKLIKDYLQPLRGEYTFDVHILGWPSNLWTLSTLQDQFPWIRSTDSAKPHVYAKAGTLLEPGGVIPKYPRRDHDYFFEAFTPEQRSITNRNIEVFKAAANAELILK